MRYSAVQNGLTLTTAYLKNYLKVDDSVDDTFIDNLFSNVKEIADNYLQNDFRSIRSNDIGIGDDTTLTFTLSEKPIEVLSLHLYLLRPGTDLNAARGKPQCFGTKQVENTTDTTNNFSLNNTSGLITFVTAPEEGEIVYADRYRLTLAGVLSVPLSVQSGVLKMLAYLYDGRTGGIQSERDDGVGSVTYTQVAGFNVPTDVIALWAPYRKIPGL